MGIFGEWKEEVFRVQMLYKMFNDIVTPDPTPIT